MPSISRQVADLRVAGPVIEVLIAPVQLRADDLVAHPVAHAVRVLAMIDTGASVTAIGASVVQALALQGFGTVPVTTAATARPASMRRFKVSVTFADGVRVVPSEVVEAPLAGDQVQCLIGRDILSAALLLYDGRASEFTLDF